jgi:hypothetical protein
VELFRKYFPESWTPLKDEYARPVDYEALALEIDALIADIESEVSVLRGR